MLHNTPEYVRQMVATIVKDQDLSRYILYVVSDDA
jgi:ATP-dependent protease HslVU (ClpYQ) ATPase subunit